MAVDVMPPAKDAGDYRSAAFATGGAEARLMPGPRIPGSGASAHGDLQLRERPSMRERVRALTVASRCKYEHVKMHKSTTQFVTRQLMERALDADGCGPAPARGAADAVIEAISRSVISGH